MRICLLIIAVKLTWLSMSAQTKFDIESFNKKFDTVQWLCRYDNIAWWTSDSVMAAPEAERSQLGAEWFCFPGDDGWHAVYGSFDNSRYRIVFHYFVDSLSKIRRINDPVDSSLANSFCRALKKSNALLKPIKDSTRVRFNQYIRRNDDQTITVWLLPAFTTNNVAVYGGEFSYRFDKSGTILLGTHGYFQGKFLGFKADEPREIWLDYTEIDKPTLGGIFFVWYYKTYFTRIVLENRGSKSTAMKDEEGNFFWVHAEKKE